jgi:hypothetical protein
VASIGALLTFAGVMLTRESRTSRARKVLETDIRAHLPFGTSRSDVEAFLRDHTIAFHFDTASRSLHALVRDLNGNWAVLHESLQLRFDFDGKSELRFIDARVVYTGP